jgi:hypothetical protein
MAAIALLTPSNLLLLKSSKPTTTCGV